MIDKEAPHLWEIEHPYYCHPGNHYTRLDESHFTYASWAEFYEDWGDRDPDVYLVFRWDWARTDPEDVEEDEDVPSDRLQVFWVLQGSAILRSTECVVAEADEPAVRKWLAARAQTMAAIWAPIGFTA